jgi:uncharacterized membrane protein SpoIIM required for sporulation
VTAARPVLRSAEFRRERQASWRELDRLLVQIEKRGIRGLGPEELVRLPVLHRAAVSSLSVARSISLDKALIRYLESLTARSFLGLYGEGGALRRSVRDFVVQRFPRLVRAYRWPMVLTLLIFLAGSWTGYALTAHDPDLYYALVPEAMAGGRTPTSTTEELRAVLYEPDEDAAEELSRFASFLFSNNAGIGLMSFVLGFLAGVPVVLLVFFNGLVLGAMTALYASRDLGLDFLFWVLPHGVTEIGALILCGGAGLVLGRALVFPGQHARLANLALEGRRAGQIVLGCVAMFLIAALIEGFFRQMVPQLGPRVLLAAFTAVAWAVYLTLGGRERSA